MTLPAWPVAQYFPQNDDSFQPIQRSLDPIATDMEGGNTRERPRPGDNVGTVTQTIWLSSSPSGSSDFDTVIAWIKTTLNLGTARFTMMVWMGSAFESKTVQFIKPGSTLVSNYIGPNTTALTMTLRVYDV